VPPAGQDNNEEEEEAASLAELGLLPHSSGACGVASNTDSEAEEVDNEDYEVKVVGHNADDNSPIIRSYGDGLSYKPGNVSPFRRIIDHFTHTHGTLDIDQLPATRYEIAGFIHTNGVGSVMRLFPHDVSEEDVVVRHVRGHGPELDNRYRCRGARKLVDGEWVQTKTKDCTAPLNGKDIFKRHLKNVHLGIPRIGEASLSLSKWAESTYISEDSAKRDIMTFP
jgi:hypothetical protein